MFKIEMIRFNNKEDFQEYYFTMHSFVYGKNTRGKTALTIAIDYVLGSGDELTYQGLDNIDSLEALLKNDNTSLWLKRTVKDKGYFFRRTEASEYSKVSEAIYKDNISIMLTEQRNTSYLNIYKRIFNENPSFRSFSFLNFIEEKGLGDLSAVFTRAKELKHNIRIRNIMNFFFNIDNIEQIYEKEVLLDTKNRELERISSKYNEYNNSKSRQKQIFQELNLDYTGDYSKDYETFCDFKKTYLRKIKSESKDLIYLLKSSFSLSEEIKLYNFMKNQSKNMTERKERVKRLLSIFNKIINDVPEYEKYISFIKSETEKLDEENVILSLTDYNRVIKNIEIEKRKLDDQIKVLKASVTQLSYEEAIKRVGLLENIFLTLSENVDVVRYDALVKEISSLKNEIKTLRNAFDQKKINKFNKRLTEVYLENKLDIKHLKEDLEEINFSIEFDPFRLCLFAKHTKNGNEEKFMPGSMARQTHLQILVYLTMFEYLNHSFKGFIHMPLLIIDSANQPMGIESFEKFYPVFIKMAEEIGVQTIFTSKDKISGIKSEDFIDISNGLNKFHKT